MSQFEDVFSFCWGVLWVFAISSALLLFSVCWRTAAFVISGSWLLIHVFPLFSWENTGAPSPYQYLYIYVHDSEGPVVDITFLCWLIIHDHLNKLHNAPWHFYWRQLTADGTNVFLSGVIMTIKVSSGTWYWCLMTRLHPVSATETLEDSSVLYFELIVLSRWATELTGHRHWCITAVWNN